MQNVYFTGDTHFGHANIIKYCERPFSSANEMDEALIANINAVVQPGDLFYHLGDWSWGIDRGDKTNNAQYYLDRINCKNVTVITGNHDPHYASGKARREFARLFQGSHEMLQIKLPVKGIRTSIVLNHYSMRVWNKSHHGAWQLYGHSHGSLPDDPNALSFDVGVDCHDFKPISLDQVAAIMATKTFTPIDHHGA